MVGADTRSEVRSSGGFSNGCRQGNIGVFTLCEYIFEKEARIYVGSSMGFSVGECSGKCEGSTMGESFSV